MNGKGLDAFYSRTTKGEHLDVMMQFIYDIGIPETLIVDGARELLSKDLGRLPTNTISVRNIPSHIAHGGTYQRLLYESLRNALGSLSNMLEHTFMPGDTVLNGS